MDHTDLGEFGHYVVTDHHPGGVILTEKCSFLEKNSIDVIIIKARRLEVRRFIHSVSNRNVKEIINTKDKFNTISKFNEDTQLFPIVLSVPVNGRITTLVSFSHPSSTTDYIFFTTDTMKWAVISYLNPEINVSNSYTYESTDESVTRLSLSNSFAPNNIITHASGDMHDYGISVRGREAECGPMTAIEPYCRCISLHMYDGFITILPINSGYRFNTNSISYSTTNKKLMPSIDLIGFPFHCRINERTILDMKFLLPSSSSAAKNMPQLAFLFQDSRGYQHVIAHSVDLSEKDFLLNCNENPAPISHRKCSGSDNVDEFSFVTHSCGYHPSLNNRLKKLQVDGGSGIIIPVPPVGWESLVTDMRLMTDIYKKNSFLHLADNNIGRMGGILILGQSHITYHCMMSESTKILQITENLILSFAYIHPIMFSSEDKNKRTDSEFSHHDTTVRYLLGDEYGNLYLFAMTRTKEGDCTGMYCDVLGVSCISNSLIYLDLGIIFLGSQFSDSQLIRILEEPKKINKREDEQTILKGKIRRSHDIYMNHEMTYICVLEEYLNLGPIVDFELVPITHSHGTGYVSSVSTDTKRKHHNQHLMITASGTGKDGSIRFIRNGIGMSLHASIILNGVTQMWNIRQSFEDLDDTFLVQSYVGETRFFRIVMTGKNETIDTNTCTNEEQNNEMINQDSTLSKIDDYDNSDCVTLKEVSMPGFDTAKPTLYVGNLSIKSDGQLSLVVQITGMEIRLINISRMIALCTWSPNTTHMKEFDEKNSLITVASANEAGQICISLRGGILLSLQIYNRENNVEIILLGQTELGSEISCIDLNPFDENIHSTGLICTDEHFSMVEYLSNTKRTSYKFIGRIKSKIVAVGLWDDYSIILVSLRNADLFKELLHIGLSSAEVNMKPLVIRQKTVASDVIGPIMIARSLCLVTLYSPPTVESVLFSPQSSTKSTLTNKKNHVNMLFVGLCNGDLLSYVVEASSVTNGSWSVHSRKEVNLGSCEVGLVRLRNRSSGYVSCLFTTGDRPTIIYLTGGLGQSKTHPKFCYSAVNLISGAVNAEGQNTATVGTKCMKINAAIPFISSLLFSSSLITTYTTRFSLCLSNESNLYLGMIDTIQKLHVTTHKLGMAPRRITYHKSDNLICVGCIDVGKLVDGHFGGGDANMGNCICFFDDTSFEEVDRMDLDPFEMILSVVSVRMRIFFNEETAEFDSIIVNNNEIKAKRQTDHYYSYIVVGTAYAIPDEDEPSKGRTLLISCSDRLDNYIFSEGSTEELRNIKDRFFLRKAQKVTELVTEGGVYSICQFYDDTILLNINSKTHLCRLINSGLGNTVMPKFEMVGLGHDGHILSLFVKSPMPKDRNETLNKHNTGEEYEQLAIIGDLMRSISLLRYLPKHHTFEEVARDYHQRWTTAIEMLNNDVYLGAETFHNIFILRRNATATSEEMRCRLDTVGKFNLGEMINKFMSGSLVMQDLTLQSTYPGRKLLNFVANPYVQIGSQTLFATVDGTIGSIIGLDANRTIFLSALEYSMSQIMRPIGNLSHNEFRFFRCGIQEQPSQRFIDGDLVESFLDLDGSVMQQIVNDMNKEQRWKYCISQEIQVYSTEDSVNDQINSHILTVTDVLSMVQELSMLH